MESVTLADATIASGAISGTVNGEARTIPLSDVLRLEVVGIGSAQPHTPMREPRVRLFLADGGVLAGDLVDAPEGTSRRLLLSLGASLTLNVPFEAVAAIQTTPGSPESDADLQTRIAERTPGRDLMLVARDERAVAVPGSLERLTPREWEFAYESRSRTGQLSQVFAFILGAPSAPVAQPEARVHLHGGNRFGASLLSSDFENLRLDAGAMGEIVVPWAQIRAIDLQSERLVHLSTLAPAEVETRSFTEAPWPPRMDASVAGGPLRIARTEYARGIGVHAFTRLTYDLAGAYERFHARVGVDDRVAPGGTVIFRILADGKSVYESPVLRGGDGPKSVSVDVSGVKSLVLECDPAGDLDLSDHGNWADAVLIKARTEGAS